MNSTEQGDAFGLAREAYEAGDYARGREYATKALSENPNDVERLRLVGRCALEMEEEDAAGFFRQIVEQDPRDAEAWRDLGNALLLEGELQEAAGAFGRVVDLLPGDMPALVDLAHLAYAMGDLDRGIALLSEAAGLEPDNLFVLRSLVEMDLRAGRLEDALRATERIAELNPDDTLALLDTAELNRALGNLNAGVAAYNRLRRIDDPEHEVYAVHGLIEIEMQRERWRRVLDLALDATRIDRFSLTTDLLAFAVAQLFGSSDRPVRPRAELDAALIAERADHRRMHSEPVGAAGGE